MMRFISKWLGCALLCSAAAGLVDAADGTDGDRVERRRIEVERTGAAEHYAMARAACYKQFEVNVCLGVAKREHQNVLAELKRQEGVLNTEERRRKAADQVRKLDERNRLENQETAAQERARRAREQLERDQRAAGKTVGIPQATPRASPADASPRPKPEPKGVSKNAPAASSVGTAQNVVDFNKKQQEAASHLTDVQKRRQERTKPLSAPLPSLRSSPP
jgi:hypothetical protein